MVVAGLIGLDELEAVVLEGAAKQCASVVALAERKTELQAPSFHGLIEVRNAQPDVMNTEQLAHAHDVPAGNARISRG